MYARMRCIYTVLTVPDLAAERFAAVMTYCAYPDRLSALLLRAAAEGCTASKKVCGEMRLYNEKYPYW